MTVELPLKQWMYEQSEIDGVAPLQCWWRLRRSKYVWYPNVKFKKLSTRRAIVVITKQNTEPKEK